MALRFNSDFEGGNGELLAIGGNEVHFRPEKRKSPYSLWWQFGLSGIAGRPIKIVRERAEEVAGGVQEYVRGCVRPVGSINGGAWRRLGRSHLDLEAGAVTWHAQFGSGARNARVAFCYPYVYSDVLRACRAWGRDPAVTAETLCTSAKGRDVPIAFLGDPDERGRDMIALVARQHAGETPGSFVLEGIMERFLAGGPCGNWARRNALIVVVPAVDVDNVAEGGYGKEEKPVDYNRDWLEPRRPQIKALRPLLADLACRHRYRVFMDLHAPWIAGPNELHLVDPGRVSASAERRGRRLARLIYERQAPDSDLARRDCFPTRHGPHTDTQRMSVPRECVDNGATGIVVETTYHLTRGGRWASPHRYRRHGHRIAEAMKVFCEEGGR